jgi:predicted nuclease of restriction endonuclease-like (RecB) superfamily
MPATSDATVGALFGRIVTILEAARERVARSVNTEMVLAYWSIGREIVQHLQKGAARADYGDRLLETLSEQLRARYGRGYSVTNLKYLRLFYQAYADRQPQIRHGTRDESRGRATRSEPHGVWKALSVAARRRERTLGGFSSRLTWTHYRTLAKVEHDTARRFYEIEAEREGWSAEHLERQIHTQLFARLLKSRDKAGVLDLASRGQVLTRPVDAIKHPYVLDFLDLPESQRLRESDLEGAILEKLQHFLLELGKGFAFVARQKRLTFDDEHFHVDLVFYNVILKCHLLIDLKLGKLTHQDVGQMDSYVRLFDEQGRAEDDGPTIGLILCAEKNEAVARYSVLRGNEQLFAAKYVTYLPSIEELQRELARERRLLDGGVAMPARRRRRRRSRYE